MTKINLNVNKKKLNLLNKIKSKLSMVYNFWRGCAFCH